MTGPGNAAAPLGPPTSALRRAEGRAADAVGALLVLWGFKRQMGRVWTVLYLSERLSRLVAHTRGAVGLLRILTEAIAGRRRG